MHHARRAHIRTLFIIFGNFIIIIYNLLVIYYKNPKKTTIYNKNIVKAMNHKLKKIINEQFSRTLNERKHYMKTRALVEQMVRESLTNYLNEKANKKQSGSIHQCRAALNDPTINMAGLIGKIPDLPNNPDSARSILSKWARGEMNPSLKQANAVLHILSTSDK